MKFIPYKNFYKFPKEQTLDKVEFERLQKATFFVIIPIFLYIQFLFMPKTSFILKEWLLKNSPIIQKLVTVYPVIVEHNTYTEPKPNQIPVLSSINSGGKGGITKNFGFHTLTNSDTFLISYTIEASEESKEQQESKNPIIKRKNTKSDIQEGEPNITNNPNTIHNKNSKESKLPTKIPANYHFRNDFALRWDHSPDVSIASVELKSYKYFRDMLRQIRENFSPPGLNLVWRDSAGLVISQTIKPQIVRVLFLLDEEGTVQDAKVVSSMGQKPVDDSCIRVLLHQNFGKPPKEIFEHGNIFGINFIFPPIY
ncbi:MAG: energy transducer TonB [Leptonema sp. (in: bacteria)]